MMINQLVSHASTHFFIFYNFCILYNGKVLGNIIADSELQNNDDLYYPR